MYTATRNVRVCNRSLTRTAVPRTRRLTQTVMTEEDRLAREAELAGEDKKASPVKRRWDIIRTVLGGADDSGSDDDWEEDDAERATPTPA